MERSNSQEQVMLLTVVRQGSYCIVSETRDIEWQTYIKWQCSQSQSQDPSLSLVQGWRE